MYELIVKLNSFLWSGPLLVLLLGTHIILTVRTGMIQKHVIKGIKLSASDSGGLHMLTATLAATLGTGNIIGVSTAIALGGPGALFWCWITGILGMATTYYECYLGRLNATDEGGGTMYVLRDSLKKSKLANIYAYCMLLVCLGTGCLTQSNAVSVSFFSTFHIPYIISGIIIAILSGLVIAGGKSQIVKVCAKTVPVMCILFIGGCIFLLFKNMAFLPETIRLILKSAFSKNSVTCGIFCGGFMSAVRYGIARGLFTNEAGIGSAAVFAGGSRLNPKDQALVSMTATFWDTVVICAITGLVIISGYLACPDSIKGYSAGGYAIAAFSQIPYIGKPLLSIAIAGFALSTIIGWFYPGEQAATFLFKDKKDKALIKIKTIYIAMVFMGSVFSLEAIWEIADLFNVFLILPNVYALIKLSKNYSSN